VSALSTANLVGALRGDGPFTVFAPNNDAFAAVDTSSLSTDQLTAILTYHVVSGTFLAANLTDGATMVTLQGDTITARVQSDGTVQIENNDRTVVASVTSADNIGSNGVVHIIDTVLIPVQFDGCNDPNDKNAIVAIASDTSLADVIVDKFSDCTLALFGIGFAINDECVTQAFQTSQGLTRKCGECFGNELADCAENRNRCFVPCVFVLNRAACQTCVKEQCWGELTDCAQVDTHIIPTDPLAEYTIYEVLQQSPFAFSNLTYLVNQLPELQKILKSTSCPDQITLFAPTDKAFIGMDLDLNRDNKNAIKSILEYHIIANMVDTTTIQDRASQQTVNGRALIFSTTSVGAFTEVENTDNSSIAKVIVADIRTSNGVIHEIDSILTPATTDTLQATMDVVERSVSMGLSDLATVLGDANLIETLRGSGPFTVLAPTNAAFAAVDTSSLSTGQLTAILTYHVISGVITSANLTDGQTITTISGVTLKVKQEGCAITLLNNDGLAAAKVISANNYATNGVIHTIDAVLIPGAAPTQDIVDLAIATSDLSSLVSALSTANLVGALRGDGPFTVFAPNNDAFAAVDTSSLSTDQLTAILTYHVVSGSVSAQELSDGQVLTTLNGATLTVKIDTDGVYIYNNDSTVMATVVSADNYGSNGVVHIIDTVLIPGLPGSSTLPFVSTTVSITSSTDVELVTTTSTTTNVQSVPSTASTGGVVSKNSDQSSSSSNVFVAVGIAGALVVIAVIAIVVLVFVYRRHRTESSTGVPQSFDNPLYSDDINFVEDGTFDPESSANYMDVAAFDDDIEA